MASEFVTAVSRVSPGQINIRGYDIRDVVTQSTFTEAIFLVLRGERPTARELKIMDALLTCCVDHGLVNTLSVAGRYVASGSASVSAAIAAGVLCFGPHTGTANLTGAMLVEIEDAARHSDASAAIEQAVVVRRLRGESVPGLGHPVHRKRDPRTEAVLDVAREQGMIGPPVELLEQVRSVASRVVGRGLVINVDGLMGALLLQMDFTPDQMLAINILTAIPGIAAHAIEEKESGRRLRYPADHASAYTLPEQTRPWDQANLGLERQVTTTSMGDADER